MMTGSDHDQEDPRFFIGADAQVTGAEHEITSHPEGQGQGTEQEIEAFGPDPRYQEQDDANHAEEHQDLARPAIASFLREESGEILLQIGIPGPGKITRDDKQQTGGNADPLGILHGRKLRFSVVTDQRTAQGIIFAQ